MIGARCILRARNGYLRYKGVSLACERVEWQMDLLRSHLCGIWAVMIEDEGCGLGLMSGRHGRVLMVEAGLLGIGREVVGWCRVVYGGS